VADILFGVLLECPQFLSLSTDHRPGVQRIFLQS
jgi:hypothetical protein